METRNRWGMVVVAVVIAVGAVAFAVGTHFFENSSAKNSALRSGDSTSQTDEDRDGLVIWEELVWKTDPKNPDTDGDGVSDGAEVAQLTDPLLPGTEPLTTPDQAQTASLVRSVESAETYIKERELTSEAAESVRKAAIESTLQSVNVHGTLTGSVLTISTSTSLSAYSQAVMLILKESTKIRDNELTLFRETLEMNNFSGTPKLKEAATLYKKIAAALLVIGVPQAISAEHLELVNSVDGMANATNLMAEWGGDPVQGMLYIDAFIKEEDRVEASVEKWFAKINKLN